MRNDFDKRSGGFVPAPPNQACYASRDRAVQSGVVAICPSNLWADARKSKSVKHIGVFQPCATVCKAKVHARIDFSHLRRLSTGDLTPEVVSIDGTN
jgi:hypothetical protein